jgi:hypothetical protein
VAIFIDGMPCGLCAVPMRASDGIVGFPAFVGNEADPLLKFSDAVVHDACFRREPLAGQVEERVRELGENWEPAQRRCRACDEPITTPDEYFGLGHLTDDPTHALHPFNYAHLHRVCVKRWPDLGRVRTLANEQLASGAWKGIGMRRLVEDLHQERPD